MVMAIGKISAGMMVLVIRGALSEMTLQFLSNVSLKRSQGSKPHIMKMAKLFVPESGLKLLGSTTENMNV
jgi:hypothetical protein